MNNMMKKLVLLPAFALLCGVSNAQELKVSSSEFSTQAPQTATVKVVGEVVKVSFDIDVPAYFINRNEAYVVVPEFRNGDWTMSLPALSIEGAHYNRVTKAKIKFKEKKYADSVVYLKHVLYKGKQMKVHYQVEVPYQPEIGGAELVTVEAGRSNCYKKNLESPTTDKPIATSLAPDYAEFTSFDPIVVAAMNVEVKKQYAYDFNNRSIFPIRSAKLDKKVYDVGYAILSDQVAQIKKQGIIIDQLSARVSSSPDGPLLLNTSLAKKRANVLLSPIAKAFGVDAGKINLEEVAENWADFAVLVKKSNWANKADILKIIDDNSNLTKREDALVGLKNYSSEIYPAFQTLRNCVLVMDYTIPVRFEQMALSNVPADIENLYEKSKNDNTLADVMLDYMRDGDFDNALNVSNKLRHSSCPMVANAQGVLFTQVGDYDTALRWFEKAGSKPFVAYNKGLLYMAKGDYEKACVQFEGVNDANAMVSELNCGRPQNAIAKSYDAKQPDAELIYLRAIAYACQSNQRMTIYSLFEACQADAAYKAKAWNQPEFVALHANARFVEITK